MSGQSELVLYGDFLSQCVRRVAIFLRHNDIAYEYRAFDLLRRENRTSPTYVALNPNMTVPTLVDRSDAAKRAVSADVPAPGAEIDIPPSAAEGGFVLFESNTIIRHVATTRPLKDQALYPSIEQNPYRRAQIDQWLDWTISALRPHVSLLMRTAYFLPLINSTPIDSAAVATVSERVVLAIEALERHLAAKLTSANHTASALFLVGNKASIADLSALCEYSQLAIIGFTPIESESATYPAAAAWRNSVLAAFPHISDDDLNARLLHVRESALKLPRV
ncbi:hypothetical protein CAOG_07101 [Capsaspora owczarzaki ATCC 30864]|nr:hypothetical protein CAOG_07101 [Capsaspora owczarzaki ATCC 30864]|eukprot:XP_004343825.1 hypothetical protein CAOG_07101 [Capsaspora owczarzaki ATCC 30864]